MQPQRSSGEAAPEDEAITVREVLIRAAQRTKKPANSRQNSGNSRGGGGGGGDHVLDWIMGGSSSASSRPASAGGGGTPAAVGNAVLTPSTAATVTKSVGLESVTPAPARQRATVLPTAVPYKASSRMAAMTGGLAARSTTPKTKAAAGSAAAAATEAAGATTSPEEAAFPLQVRMLFQRACG